MKQKELLQKHGKKIDYTFLVVLVSVCLLFCIYYGVTNTYNPANKNIANNLSDTTPYVYDNFWHKFNTFTVVMINIKDNKHLVTLNEQDQFQKIFFKDFGLTNNDRNIERNETAINPDILFCYMRHYNPPNSNILEIRTRCDK